MTTNELPDSAQQPPQPPDRAAAGASRPIEHQNPPIQPGGKGLRPALFIALVLALVLPGVVAGLVLIHLNLQRTVDVDARVRAEKFADLLQAGLTLPLWQIAADTGQPLMEAVAADPSVATIRVTGAEGETLLAFDRGGTPPPAAIRVDRAIEKSGESLGRVTLTYSTSAARRHAEHASIFLLAVIAAQFLASLALIGTWLTRRVLKPLGVLRASAETISAGDLQREVPPLSDDEFGVLASALNAMRESLAQSVTQLEDRVAERTHALTEVNTRLQCTLEDLRRAQTCLIQSEKLASLGSLVAGVAHELNTPIGTGITVVSTISERCTELRAQLAAGIRRSELDSFIGDVAEASALAESSLGRAAQLLQDFKQIAVDQTSARRRTFDLARTVQEIMAALNLRHRESPIRIEVQIPDGIRMDSYPGAIEQIIANLVDNAILHGYDGRSDGTIQIVAAATGQRVRLTVADDGCGIAAGQLPRIFDPFFTTRLGQGGSGLGLSIAFGLVNGILGGQISADSTVGRGSVFTLDLPLTAPDHPERTKG